MFSVWLDGKLLYSSAVNDPYYAIGTPILTLEAGKAGSLSFTMYPNHPEYDSLRRMLGRVIVYENDTELFRGRILRMETNLYKERKVTCEGDLAYLMDSISDPGEYTESISAHFSRLVDMHNSQVESDKQFAVGIVNVDKATESQTFKTDSYRTTSAAMSDDLTGVFGGYIRTRRSGGTVYLDYIGDYGKAVNQNIEFGVNMIDVSESVSSDDIFTVLLPTGSEGVTMEGITGSKYVKIPNAVERYGTVVRAVSFSDIKEAGAELMQAAYDYIEKNYKEMPPTLTLTAIDLKRLDFALDGFELGTRIGILSEPHGINGSPVCSKISYNLEYPEKNIYLFSEIENIGGSNRSQTVATGSTKASGGGGGDGGLSKWIKATDDMLKLTHDKMIVLQVQNSKLTIDAEGMHHEVSDMKGNISKLENTTEGLTSTVQNNTGDISTLTNTALGLTSRVESAEGNIATLQNTAIGLTHTVEGHDGRIATLKNTVDGFSSTYVTKSGLVQEINNNEGGILIKSSKINLSGYVTANQLDAKLADVTWLSGKVVSVSSISASAGHFDNLYCGGNNVVTMGDLDYIIERKGLATQSWVTSNFEPKT
jgi:hypothetical protein